MIKHILQRLFGIKPAKAKLPSGVLPDDAYVIRLTDHPDIFVHVEKETDKEITYMPKDGIAGAAIWTHKMAKRFIKKTGADNVEAVKFIDVVDKK